jgi:hypothetical protein
MISHFKIIYLIFFTIITFQSLGQDLIITRKGIEITSKVLEITLDAVKYKKFENINGPTYSIGKNEVLIIRYQNGTKSIFDEKVNSVKSSDIGTVDENLSNSNTEVDLPIENIKKNSFNLMVEVGKTPYAPNNFLSYGLGIGYAIGVKSSRFKIQNELIYRKLSTYYNYYAFSPSLQFSFRELVSKLNFIGGVGPSVYLRTNPNLSIKANDLGYGANIYAGIKFNKVTTKVRFTPGRYDNLTMFGIDYSF